MTDSPSARRNSSACGLVNGLSATALGIVAVSLAVLEYHVFVETAGPVAGGGAAGIFDVTFGTGAYILGYLGAGAILLAIGFRTILRSIRGV